MIQRGFDEILDFKKGERFIFTDNELGISVIGAPRPVGTDIVIDIISVVDSARPTNPYNTYTIAI